jgi:hypothetical protein
MSADVLAAFDEWLDQHAGRLVIPVQVIERDHNLLV